MARLSQNDPAIGTLVLGRYHIVRLLARGGMGAIYLARNKGAAGFVRPAVVKQILPGNLGDESAVEMFAREARIMSSMRHPGIVSVIDFAKEDDRYVMVLEYVHGPHVGRWLRFYRKIGKPFRVDLALQIIIHLLDALDHAHTATSLDGTPLHVVHRDIKPSNIIVDVSGHVKLADFGIARAPNDKTEASEGSTKLKGTFPYLAPELLEGVDPSPSTDVYACGVVLHTLISGKNEFVARDVSSTVLRVLKHIPVRLDHIRDDVTKLIADVVARSMDKDPTKRFQSAAEFATALRQLRQTTESEANDALRRTASGDFRDERFATLLQCDDLSVLEKALTEDYVGNDVGDITALLRPDDLERTVAATDDALETDPSISRAVDMHTPVSEPATAVEIPRERDPSEPRLPAPPLAAALPRRSTLPLVLAITGAAGLIAAAVIVVGVLNGAPADGPPIVLSPLAVPGTQVTVPGAQAPMPAGSTDLANTAVPAGAAPAPGETVGSRADAGHSPANQATPGRRPSKKSPKSLPLAQQLQMRVHAKRGAVRSCFDSHPEVTARVGRFDFIYKINHKGRVQSFSLAPAKYTKTALGACLTRVGRSVRFPATDGDLEFSVPIRPNSFIRRAP